MTPQLIPAHEASLDRKGAHHEHCHIRNGGRATGDKLMNSVSETWIRPYAYPDLATAWDRLTSYLGDQFSQELTDFELLRRFLDREWVQLGPRFYERSVGYLYDLTFFHYMNVKDAFFELITSFTQAHRLNRIADIGCGVALDAQALIQIGYDVDAYDLVNPSLAYARWRYQRDLPGDHRIQAMSQLPGRRYDLAYAVDVIGHSSDPLALIKLMLSTADHVVLNLPPHDLRHRYGPADLHPGLDHSRILPAIQERATLITVGTNSRTVITVWRSNERQ
ncbi:MAG: class I SAM-dependent methyltransferase [Streptosporangiaceae bacterium]